MKVVFSAMAQMELEEIVVYYDSEKLGFGNTFQDTVIETLNKLKSFPEAYAKISLNIRRIVLSKFPYNIFYNYSNDLITIISIGHQRKKPFYTTQIKEA
jgi:plasmid stabilization system protein ParE